MPRSLLILNHSTDRIYRTTEAARQTDTDAERDDRRGDGPHHRRGYSDGRFTDSAHARGRAEQIADGGSREANESGPHTERAEIPRGM